VHALRSSSIVFTMRKELRFLMPAISVVAVMLWLAGSFTLAHSQALTIGEDPSDYRLTPVIKSKLAGVRNLAR